LWGFVAAPSPRCRPLRWAAAGFLPMLFVYGGRFWMHSAPLWALFGGTVARRFLPERKPLAAAALFALCTAIPIPSIYFPHRAPGATVIWSESGLRRAIACALLEREPDADFGRLANFITQNTAPREIVHVERNLLYLADRIFVATGRRVDVGGWAVEVRSAAMLEAVEDYRRRDTDCLFVYTEAPPAGEQFDSVIEFGKYAVGVRGKSGPLEEQVHPPEDAPPGAFAP
jgi:hypothetical protein